MSQPKHIFSVGLVRFVLMGILTLVVAACRPQAAVVLPTPIPTLTSVPRSTPLPPLPTNVPVGKKDSPIHIIFHPTAKLKSDSTAVADLESAIEKKTSLVVKIDVVDSDAAALAALCASSPTQPTLAWLSGIGYIAANAEKCGQPQLLVSRGTGTSAATGQIVTVIARRGIDSLASVKGRIFCRIGNTDLVSWLIPSLLMRAAGINPEIDPKTIKDYAGSSDLVSALASNQCDIAAIPDASVKELITDNKSVSSKVSTILSSVEFPYSVLVASSDIPLSAITALNDEFMTLSKDRQLKTALSELLDQSTLVPVKPEDLQPLLDFAATTGQNFAQLGN
ncbi:MAG: PhnD/SsuA/transferrin family substrate-binding protein [Anaerolineae bacterium]|nr:PhnD/SsuA/transferrin family substrate-binding protein [Anaerolineae bacterium]